MAESSTSHPSILDKVSAKTRGILVQGQREREAEEAQGKQANMSTEQT